MTDAPTLWSVAEARAARDAALERVHDAPWASFAMQALQTVARREPTLSSEDEWKQLDSQGIPRPPEQRCIGPVMVRGVREGLIAPLGYTTGSDPRHHADICRTYRSRVFRR